MIALKTKTEYIVIRATQSVVILTLLFKSLVCISTKKATTSNDWDARTAAEGKQNKTFDVEPTEEVDATGSAFRLNNQVDRGILLKYGPGTEL